MLSRDVASLNGVITIDGLVKRRGTKEILSGVGFQARPGRVTGFLGPNGAGKSSTLRILLGLDRAQAGTALIDGVPFAALPDPVRTVGAVLDGSGAHRSRTGRAHLRWVARAGGLPRSRVDEVLELVGLADAGSKRVGGYSLGMGRRLALATALLGDPAVLVLDEPRQRPRPGGHPVHPDLPPRAGPVGAYRPALQPPHGRARRDRRRRRGHRPRADRRAGDPRRGHRAHRTLEDAFFALVSR